MKRLYTCFATALLCLPLRPEAATEKYRLIWNNDPATTMTVGWNQRSGDGAMVYYGLTDHGTNYLSYPLTNSADRTIVYRGMNNHFARLTGLTPNTNYYFVVRDADGVSDRMWFRTAPDQPAPMTFIAGGDSRTHAEGRTWGNQLIAKIRPLFIAHGGDYMDSGTNAEWDQWFDEWQETKSTDGRMYPVIAAHGNHENNDRRMVYNLFDMPQQDGYFALTVGGNLCRLYTLNSELQPAVGSGMFFNQDDAWWDAQTAWLEQDMATQSTGVTWKVANYHRPIVPHRSSKTEGPRRRLNWGYTFYRYGMDLAIECDSHLVKHTFPVRPATGPGSWQGYVRDDQRGIVFTGEGSWGAPTRNNDDDKPWTRASGTFWQFKLVHMDASRVRIRTVKFGAFPEGGSLVPYDPGTVTALTQPEQDADAFALPAGLDLWNPPTGEVVTIPFGADAPTPPDNLQATPVTTRRILVSWDDNSSDETGFVLSRKMGRHGMWQVLDVNLAADTTAYLNTGLSPDTTYSYRLSAVGSNGLSQSTVEVTTRTPPRLRNTSTALQSVAFSAYPEEQYVATAGTVDFSPRIVGGRTPFQFSWDFADGHSTNGINPSHTFAATGCYEVVLSVTDATPSTLAATNEVCVRQPEALPARSRIHEQGTATLGGKACLAWEAEDADALIERCLDVSRWEAVGDETASCGRAIRATNSDGGEPGALANMASYKLRFTEAGDYYLYFRARAAGASDGFVFSFGDRDSFYTPGGGLGDTVPANSAYGDADDYFDDDGVAESEELKETFDWYYFMDENSLGLVPLVVSTGDVGKVVSLSFGARDPGMMFDRFCLVKDATNFTGGVTVAALDTLDNVSMAQPYTRPAVVGFQAEQGILGSDWVTVEDGDAEGDAYAMVQTDVSGNVPGDETRVATYRLRFPRHGVYDLYTRIQCTPVGNSLLYGAGFGELDPTSDLQWVKVDGVDGDWFYWYNLSQDSGGSGETPTPFDVTTGSLTRTFQVGGREPTRIDAFCFAERGVPLTNEQLDKGALGPRTLLIVE